MRNTISIGLTLMLVASPSWAKGHGPSGHTASGQPTHAIATISVYGNDKTISITQRSKINTVTVDVYGNEDSVSISQIGRTNSVTAVETGNNDSVSVSQVGVTNKSNVSQYGASESASVSQVGHNNESAISQAAVAPAAVSPSTNATQGSFIFGDRRRCLGGLRSTGASCA